MRQFDSPQVWVVKYWPKDFDFREEIAKKQEPLTCSNVICDAKECEYPTHSFEYDF